MKHIFGIVLCAGILLAFSSCNKDKDGQGAIIVNLTDAPAAYQQVNVDIQAVEVHMVPTSGTALWITLPTQAGVYDLLTLQNGIDSTIVNATQLPAGKITQMRLILGSNNTVMETNITYPLTVPSGTESGIKLPGPIQVNPNTTLRVLLDFDASKSVIDQGNQEYQLKPVIQAL